MWETIINGVLIIFGVLVGFSLKLITEIGKIEIYLNDLNIHYFSPDGIGGFKEIDDYKEENSSSISGSRIYFDIDILNTSGKNKVIRDLQILIFNNSERVKGDIGDLDTKTRQNNQIHIETTRPFTIPPNNIVNKRLQFLIKTNVPDLKKCVYYFTYRDKKNKLRKTKLNIDQFIGD